VPAPMPAPASLPWWLGRTPARSQKFRARREGSPDRPCRPRSPEHLLGRRGVLRPASIGPEDRERSDKEYVGQALLDQLNIIRDKSASRLETWGRETRGSGGSGGGSGDQEGVDQAEAEQSAWLQGLVARLARKGCGREEICFLIGFSVPEEWLPPSCPCSVTAQHRGRLASELGFLPQGTVCEGALGPDDSKGQRCTLSEACEDGNQHAWVVFEVTECLTACSDQFKIDRSKLRILAPPGEDPLELSGSMATGNKFDKFDAELSAAAADLHETAVDHFVTKKFG